MDVLRWGRSAYETESSLALEAEKIRLLGGTWRHEPHVRLPEDARTDVLVVNSGVRVDAAVLETTQCDLVLTTTSGVDHIDLEACRTAKTIVGRCPLARRDAVIEHALSAMIWLRRQLPALHEAASEGRWARGELPELKPNGVNGATIAVVGLGVIGKRIATLLDMMGATVLGVDPDVRLDTIQNVSIDEAIENADIVTLHCGLTPSSRNLMNRSRLSALRSDAVVINTARGPLLDVEFAAQQVHQGDLAGLAVDVFPEEPYPSLKTLHHPNVLLTPHASGYTDDLGRRVSQEVYDTLTCWVNGTPLPYLIR